MSEPVDPQAPSSDSRRAFLRSTAALGTLGAGSALMGTTGTARAQSAPIVNQAPPNPLDRAQAAFELRQRVAAEQLATTSKLPWQRANGDDDRYAGERFYASFTKTLPSNEFGEVVPWTYWRLRRAMRTGAAEDFERIRLDASASRRLANPQGAFRLVYAGLDGHATRMRPAPTFRGAETAAEIGEVYWLALTRDVPFARYDSDPNIALAVADLNRFSAPVGPKTAGAITEQTLFRGATPGDLTGPYISQFLWKDVPYGPSLIEQRYEVPLAGRDFMTGAADWLNIQRGGAPLESLAVDPVRRYIFDNRSLGEYVHRDVLFQAYFNAALIALGYGAGVLDTNNPYVADIDNQGAFTSLGAPWVLDLVTQAGNLALAGAWYQKWRVHRRLRPETYGGRVHHHLSGNRSYELHPDILNSFAVSKVFSRQGSYFLPMAYTEGSPTHPAYPAGHATVAGACTTVLKACFREDFVIPDPVVANDRGDALDPYGGAALTLGGELNKLANNVALGRDAAGVHYRSDGEDGLLVGEQQAIVLLQESTLALNEFFEGFRLTRFDGSRIRIVGGEVLPD
ncbi:MAG: vanadium-dependent haloperoxidase [Pseudomonadota bacterium]